MIIEKLLFDLACYGPISYALIWRCEACSLTQELRLFASLLVERQCVCKNCGAQALYTFESVLHLLERLSADDLAIVDRTIQGYLSLEGKNVERELGKSLQFALSVYFANVFQEEGGRRV